MSPELHLISFPFSQIQATGWLPFMLKPSFLDSLLLFLALSNSRSTQQQVRHFRIRPRSTALPNTPFDCSQDRSQASFSESGSAHCLSLVLGSPPGEENGTHSSVLARKVPWTEEHGRLQSTGSQKVGYDWVTSLRLFSTYSLNQSVCNTQAHSWLHFTHTHRHTDAQTHTHTHTHTHTFSVLNGETFLPSSLYD